METLLCLPNITSHSITERSFWNEKLQIPNHTSKLEFKRWAATPTTQHCVFSTVEGVDPHQRVQKGANDPRKIRGIVADYDAKFDDKQVQDFVSRSLESNNPVSYFGRSFSGGIHAVWLFESPVLVLGAAPAVAFLKRVGKELHLSALARGLDPKYSDPTMYYTVGGEWNKVSDFRVPTNLLYFWQYETSKAKDFDNIGVALPLDEVHKEVTKQFPGRWKGPFVDGARGVRFWDSQADNDTAAVIRDTGVQCFTGDQPFVPWNQILGPQFVNKFTAKRVGEAIARFYYDGQSFWNAADDCVEPLNRSDMILSLKVEHGFLSKPRKGEQFSELEQALSTIISGKRVEGALPFIFDRRKLVRLNGKEYLNTSTTRPMNPAHATRGRWGENFPHFAQFLSGLFGKTQLPYFLSWLSRFYQGALSGKPQPGQAVFILGDPDSGKTLLNTRYLSAIFGGHQRPADFLLHRNNWNGNLFESGLWTLDDEVGEVDKAKFSGRLKEFVANYDFHFSEKWRKGGLINWKGRIVSTLNCDYESIRLLPDLDMNIVDKLMVFKTSTPENMEFTEELIGIMDAELPYFCLYLRGYKIPESIQGGSRFGVKSYIDPTIRRMTLVDNKQSYLIELIDLFHATHKFDDGENYWEGTASEFVRMMSHVGGANSLFKNTNPQAISRGLSHLVSKGHPLIQRSPVDGSGLQKWRILKHEKAA